MQKQLFREDFFKKIKAMLLIFSIILLFVGVTIHFYIDGNTSSEIARNRCLIASACLTFCVVILEYYPEKHGIVSPVLLVICMISMGDIYASSDAYVMHEYALP